MQHYLYIRLLCYGKRAMRPLVVASQSSAARTAAVRSRQQYVSAHRVIRCNVSTQLQQQAVGSQPDLQTAWHADPPAPAVDLLQWAASRGGVVHPSLVVTDDAPCGCRGVVAAYDVTLSSCQTMWAQHSNPPEGPSSVPPLIAVPEQLCMTSEDALYLLSEVVSAADPTAVITKRLGSNSTTGTPHAVGTGGHSVSTHSTDSNRFSKNSIHGPMFLQQALGSLGQLLGLQPGGQQALLQQRLRQLQPPMLLALVLAQQRRLGAHSFWHAYISTLPEQPPCAWYSTVAQQLLGKLPYSSQESRALQQQVKSGIAQGSFAQHSTPDIGAAALATAAAAVAAKCAAAADVFGSALGGISAAEVAWAFGQVASRAFATGSPGTTGIALLPVIDMLNHAAGAAVPVCWLGLGGEGVEQQQPDTPPAAAAVGGSGAEGVDGGYWCIWHQRLTEWEGAAAGPGCGNTHVSSDCSSSSSSDGVVSMGVSEAGSGEIAGSDGDTASEGVRADDPVLLCQGEELYISYMSNCDAAAAYLSFGFVPPELKQA